jgi:hypothetical protein
MLSGFLHREIYKTVLKLALLLLEPKFNYRVFESFSTYPNQAVSLLSSRFQTKLYADLTSNTFYIPGQSHASRFNRPNKVLSLVEEYGDAVT